MLLRNPFTRLQTLLAAPPLQIGTVAAISDDVRTVDLVGGGSVLARGTASVGQRVYVRGGVIEGVAPSLPVELITV